MKLNDILNHLELESDAIVLLIAGLAVVLVLLLTRKRILARIREWRIQRSLDQIGCEQLRNLVCPDGLDGFFNIDRLVLTGDAIVLISYKLYSGNIYCAEHISEWTQIIGQKSFKFANPLFELENQLTSLKLLIGNAPIEGYLFFNQSAEFPKGHPDRVLYPGNIPERFINVNEASVNPKLKAAWDLLKAHQQQSLVDDRIGVRT